MADNSFQPDDPIPACLDSGPGDDRIQALLTAAEADGGTVVPARACRLDGFADDTVTEYANPSVLRPPAVRLAQAPSSLSWVTDRRGGFYLGFTLYAAAGTRDCVHVRVGHRVLGRVRVEEGDNRLHLFTLPRKLQLRGGERIRLEASGASGACRLESLVMLSRRPASPRRRLEIRHLEFRSEPEPEGRFTGRVTLLSSRPASGRIGLRHDGRWSWRTVDQALQNHEAEFPGLPRGAACQYRVELVDGSGQRRQRSGRARVGPVPKRGGRRISLWLRSRRRTADVWPVSTGFPLPEGAVHDAQGLQLIAGRRPQPAQFRALNRWPDGSLKWVLADFHSDGVSDLRVRSGTPPGPGPGQAAPESQAGLVRSRSGTTDLDTGVLRMSFPPGSLLPRLQAPGAPRARTAASDGLVVEEEDGTTFGLRPSDVQLVVEEDGPVRACVRVQADLVDAAGNRGYRAVLRYHAWAGSDLLRCCCWLEVADVQSEAGAESGFRRLRSASLEWSVPGLDAERELAGQRRRGPGALRLRQATDRRFRLTTGGGRPLRSGRRADGLAWLSGDAGHLDVAVPEFWQRYPTGLEVDGSRLRLEICPPLVRGEYRGRSAEEQERLYFHLKDGVHRLRGGLTLSAELWLRYRLAGGPQRPAVDATASELLAHASRPPLLAPDLAHLNRCRVLPSLPAKDPSPRPAYEAWVSEARSSYELSRNRFRCFGQLCYGDWFGERHYNWGNLEYDASWAFLQEYLRGGHVDFADWAGQAARHLCDVDTVHDAADPGRLGWQYSHCVGHVGGYYPEGYREMAQFSGRWSASHTWVEGLYLQWLLRGDRRLLESALLTSRLLSGRMVNDYDFDNCRTSGWHLIHLCAAYGSTGRRSFLNAARLIVDRVLERQRPSGGWDRLMVPGHCYCEPPRHRGNAGFMVGILMTGLQRFHEVTGEARVAAAIVAAAAYCIDSMWEPDAACFRYTSCPRSSLVRVTDMRILKGIAFASRISQQPRFSAVLDAGLDAALAGGGGAGGGRGAGKGICARMRGAPQVLAAVPAPG